MAKKVLLCGAGSGAINYIHNNKTYKIVAVVDNSIEKRGGFTC